MLNFENKILKMGFIVNNLGPNQLSYQLINSANSYLRNKDDTDVAAFYHSMSPIPYKPNFGLFHLFEAFNYNGYMIATNLHSASRMLSWPGPNRHKMYLYCYDLDWLRLPQKQWEQLAQIYLNPKLHLISRSQNHAEILGSTWKTPISVIEDCNFSRFAEFIRKDNENGGK
jgi:hypothetical protein